MVSLISKAFLGSAEEYQVMVRNASYSGRSISTNGDIQEELITDRWCAIHTYSIKIDFAAIST